jgi:hypothetical protein
MKGGVLAVVMLTTAVAAADPARTVQLDVAGACDLASIEPRTTELLGRAAFDSEARAHIGVVTAADGGGATATLTFVDENGTAQPAREMTAASCDELAESVAIVISLVLRQAAPEAPLPAPPPPAPTPPAPAPTALAPMQDDSGYVPLAPTRAITALELAAALSTAKQSALVGGGRLEYARTALVADVEVAMPASVEVLQGAVHVASARVDAGGCARIKSFAVCGLIGGGVIRARGEDLMDARTAIRPVASLSARAEWRRLVARQLGVRLFAAGEQALVRPSFVVDDVAVWTTPLRQLWLGAGIYFQIP